MGKLSEKILSRRHIEGLIADGKAIIIYNDKVLSVNAWLNFHPGGDKAIRHMIGRDATDEINCLHSVEARKQMLNFTIGKIQGHWENFEAPIHGGKFRPIDNDDPDSAQEVEVHAEPVSPTIISDTESGSQSPSSVSSDDHRFLLDPSLLRRRKRANSSSSSMTSVSLIEPESDKFDADYLTRKGIETDIAKYPSLDDETQGGIKQKYRELEKRIRAEGLYNCNYWAYGRESIRYTMLFAGSLACVHYGWYKVAAFLMGSFWHQLVFAAHDAGHMGITHNFQIDTTIGIIIADFLGGLSLGWWKMSHNVHHIVTNDPEHDPDIEHLPFFAVSHRFFGSLFSTYYNRVMPFDAIARVFVPLQAYLYYPILLFGRFNLYRLSWEYLLLGLGPKKGIAAWHRWFEISGMVVFWYWFGYHLLYLSIPTNWDRFCFVMISHMVTAPLHVQITLSHFAMSTSDLGVTESFPQKMLRTTMDVDCAEWLDFFHGGLQFQAIHHLFPRIPRHNLRRTQKLVMEFCKDVGIPYAIYGFYDGNKEIIGHLGEVGRQARVLAACQASITEKADYGHH
ncbi:fatty acid desaturase-domain-containing protein [Geopyxis carbonaria]|nr:fatty acid desaturase-domain-containing protein [Geopyxis carbonaria]